MKNKERYAKEIIEIACDGNGIAVDKRTGAVYSCDDISCTNCLFATNNNCCDRREWAESEYIEKPVISKRDRAFLEYLGNDLKYIARDNNTSLYAYREKPSKSYTLWKTKPGLKYLCVNGFIVDFPMVKWSDSESWIIEDLKKLEVVDEYGKE